MERSLREKADGDRQEHEPEWSREGIARSRRARLGFERGSLLELATGLLLALGALRMLVLVLHEPMLGYANNGDFARLSAWFDLWPEGGGVNPRIAVPAAPHARWHVDESIAAPGE